MQQGRHQLTHSQYAIPLQIRMFSSVASSRMHNETLSRFLIRSRQHTAGVLTIMNNTIDAKYCKQDKQARRHQVWHTGQ